MFFFPTTAEIAKPPPNAFPYTTMSGLKLFILYTPPSVTLQPDVISSEIIIRLFFFRYRHYPF